MSSTSDEIIGRMPIGLSVQQCVHVVMSSICVCVCVWLCCHKIKMSICWTRMFMSCWFRPISECLQYVIFIMNNWSSWPYDTRYGEVHLQSHLFVNNLIFELSKECGKYYCSHLR